MDKDTITVPILKDKPLATTSTEHIDNFIYITWIWQNHNLFFRDMAMTYSYAKIFFVTVQRIYNLDCNISLK